MTNNELHKSSPVHMEKAADKYTGMREMNWELSPNVLMCAAGGLVLGLILAMWVTSDIGMIAATVIVFTILSGIFGMFV
jgi:uncharacterized protein YacL